VKKFQNTFLSLVSGILLALSFPPLPFFMLAFVAFIPILFIFASESHPRRMFLKLYLTFFIYHAGSNWWIGSWQADTDPYLTASAIALALAHPFFFMIPFIIFNIFKRRYSTKVALNLFPFIWVAFEWAHSLGEFSYPWLTYGNTQFYNSIWIQFIDITGIWGSSFLVLSANILILKIILEYRKKNQAIELNNKFIRKAYILLTAIIIFPLIYGIWAKSEYSHDKLKLEYPSAKIGVVQPNINPWRKWEGGVEHQVVMHFALEDSVRAVSGKPDLFIWSETSYPKHTNVENIYEYYMFYERVLATGVPLMMGFAEIRFFEDSLDMPPTARVYPWDSTQIYESYNSAMLVNPVHSSEPQTYRKMRLTPFAERMPYSEYLLFMRSWFEWGVGISSWGRGLEQKNLFVETEKVHFQIAPIICIESIYPSFVAEFTAKGANVMSVITNDAWYDYTPGPEQHYIIAALRAIENRRYLARCANSGVSGFISPTGNSISKMPQYTQIASIEQLPLMNNITIYVRYRDYLPITFSVILLFSLIFSFFSKKNQEKRQ